MTPTLRFFVDFDGTITRKDAVDMLLEKFASDQWKDVEREWVQGRIGSRECLTRQVALMRATPAQLDALLKTIEIDPGFADFLSAAAEHPASVTIVSDGFDLVISRVLRQAGIAVPRFFSNRLTLTASEFKVSFPQTEPCEHACANCKARLIALDRGAGDRVIFIGDGLSDRFGAAASDLTFAKNKLLEYCRDKGIHHRAWSDFSQITAWLKGQTKGQAWETQKANF